MKILMVLTSNGRLGNTGQKTGLWLEEFAAPYYVFKDNDMQVTLASPAGGQPPIDPKSDAPDAQTEATRRFQDDADAQERLANTVRLETIDPEDFDAIFYPGGHGPLWDLAEDDNSISLIESFFVREKPIGCVCHGPAALLHAKGPDGFPLVKGKRVTGFTNREENWVQMSEVVPFMIEDMLSNKGGLFSKGNAWKPHIEVDGNLVTGQNPASSKPAAEAIVQLLRK
ncbi:MAG TPA: type 1 glutamine amidotransferase domain-containing protein [Desulfobulbaceae bacterium]|nr:type 1 glutamine amidotransferase domain-containing protein [Desulfobulbaceae bacterium]